MSVSPTPEEQLAFLSKIQRIFAEGEFTATYKFALLISLAEIAIEFPSLSPDAELEVSLRSIAVKFVELYWRQSFEYVPGHAGSLRGVLAQNRGEQAAVVTALREFRLRHGAACTSLAIARRHSQFDALTTRVATIVSDQPVNYLQNFGGRTDEFLFKRGRPGFILLRPGIAACMRRFQPLIQQLGRAHWMQHIKSNRRNLTLVGGDADLESFLFSSPRAALVALGRELRKLTGSSCFYCGGPLAGEVDVDHFVPFATYPRDLGHNFVVAHGACNRSKSDSLAAYDHLARWLERNHRYADDLAGLSEQCGILHDSEASRAIVRWSYRASLESDGVAWIARGRYDPVGSRYMELFA